MRKSDFTSYVLPSILKHEGGYVDDPDDSGGATNYGISLRYLEGLPKRLSDINEDGLVDKADIQALTPKTAAALYWRMWQRSKAPGIARQDPDWPVALKFFDIVVNAGHRRASILLQRSIEPELTVDGLIGPKTLRALREQEPAELVQRLAATQAAFYRDIATGRRKKFLKGWLRRAFWVPR